jgi:hypothetical protein
MNFKIKYYANKSGIVKTASNWPLPPHRHPDLYFKMGELSQGLAPYYVNWPERMPVVYRSIRGNEVEQVGVTFGYSEWLEKVIQKEIGMVEGVFFIRFFWSKYIDEYCSLILSKNEDGEYVVSERIHDYISDDKVLCASIHFLEAILCIAAYVRGESHQSPSKF